MDHIEAPALLAYKDGDVFATIVEILRQIPKGRSCSADSLEDLLRSYVTSLYPFLSMTKPLTIQTDTVSCKRTSILETLNIPLFTFI